MENIKTRADLEFHFDAVLNNNYKDIKKSNKFSYGRNAVKSYVVETHIFKEQLPRDEILSSILSRAKEVNPETKLNETHEASLVNLETDHLSLYLDISNPRYIVFHSANSTKKTDPFIKKFYSANGYDSIWLPVPLLLQTTDFGRFWGMGVSFQQALEEPNDDLDAYFREPIRYPNFVHEVFKVGGQTPVFKYVKLIAELVSLSVNGKDHFEVSDLAPGVTSSVPGLYNPVRIGKQMRKDIENKIEKAL